MHTGVQGDRCTRLRSKLCAEGNQGQMRVSIQIRKRPTRHMHVTLSRKAWTIPDIEQRICLTRPAFQAQVRVLGHLKKHGGGETAIHLPTQRHINDTMSSNVTPFSFFPTSTAAPCAFGLFGQDPRDTHATYEDLAAVMARPSKGPTLRRTRSVGGNSFVDGLRRFFRGF